MKLTKLSVRRPIAMLMCILAVLSFSMVALFNLPLELMPDIKFPMLIIMTTYTGASPNEVESLVTTRIEKALSTVSGLSNMTSESSEGMSLVILEFDYGVNLDYTALGVREKLETSLGELPDGTTKPSVVQFDFRSQPIANVAIGGHVDSREYIVENIVPQFERISGVASASVSGGAEQEVTVELLTHKMAAYGITSNDIVQAVAMSDVNLPLGTLNFDDKDLLMRGQYQVGSVRELQRIPMTTRQGEVIRLMDVANIYQRELPASSISKLNGENCLMISMQKRQSANTVGVCDDIYKMADKLKAEGMNVNVVMDQGESIKNSLTNVLYTMLLGGAIAILVLCFFLGSVKTALIIGTSIPISVFITLALIYFADMTLNIVSMGGLVIGIGMMVDSSIVVLESIFRQAEHEPDFEKAAIGGTQKVAGAVVASTLTTVAVFLPIVFVQGMTSEMFGQAALTITFSLAASLISALTVVPSLFVVLKPTESKGNVIQKFLLNMENSYGGIVGAALRHKGLVMFISFGLLFASFGLAPLVGMEFIAPMDQGSISVIVTAPNGTGSEEIIKILESAETAIAPIEDISNLVITYNGGSSMMSASNSASVSVKLIKKRKLSTAQNAQIIRDNLKNLTGAEFNVSVDSMIVGSVGGMMSTSVTYYSPDDEKLQEAVGMAVEALKEIDGVINVKSPLQEGLPEAKIVVDALKAGAFGMTPSYVYQNARFATEGQKAADMDLDGRDMPVVIRYANDAYATTDKLAELEIMSPSGQNVRLSQIATIEYGFGPVSISRQNSSRTMTIQIEQVETMDSGTLGRAMEAKLAKLALPSGVTRNAGGVQETMMEAFSGLLSAAILSLALVYMIMAAQFESMRFSFVVMLSVPLAFIGGIVALVIGKDTLNVASFIGAIMLLGLVVNNAIVFIDAVEQLRQEGIERTEAIINAGKTRLRPILMTTLTTILSLLPLGIGLGEGSEMMRSMALVTIGGMTSSTVLTLVVIPVVYVIFDKKPKKRKKSKMNELIEQNL